MAQIRDGCYRIVATTDEDVDLVDLHGTSGKFVTVEKAHREYAEDFETRIEQLNPGNCIHAKLQSEDIYRIDGIWRFLEVDCYDNTVIHSLELPDVHFTDISFLDTLLEGERSSPEYIERAGEKIGFKIALPDPRGSDPHGPVVTAYKEFGTVLSKLEEPPYEIVSYTVPGYPFEFRYHFASVGTETAQGMIEQGEYLLGGEVDRATSHNVEQTE